MERSGGFVYEQPKDDGLNATWMVFFGHPYTACKFLSGIPGELGEVHTKHIAYFIKYTDQTLYENRDPTTK